MATLASDVMARSGAYLNDASQGLWTNAVLLPYLQQAAQDLVDEFLDHGIGTLREVSAALAVLVALRSLGDVRLQACRVVVS